MCVCLCVCVCGGSVLVVFNPPASEFSKNISVVPVARLFTLTRVFRNETESSAGTGLRTRVLELDRWKKNIVFMGSY